MDVNSIPFPRFLFFTIAEAPLFARADAKHVKVTVQEISYQMWSSRNFLANSKPGDNKYLAASSGYRGNIAKQEVDDKFAKVQQRMNDDFVTLISNMIASSISVPPEDTSTSGVFVAKNTV